MSLPIKVCEIVKAAKTGNYKNLERKTKYNQKFGGFTLMPCTHKPRCTDPTQRQFELLFEAIPSLLVILTWNKKP